MKIISEEQVPITGDNVNTLSIEVQYTLETYNMFTYKPQSRGYYLSVRPVNIEQHNGCRSVTYTAFTGTRWLLLACERQSKAREAKALEVAAQMRDEAIRHVLTGQGLQLAG